MATVIVLSGLVGLWLFTTPEPTRVGPPSAQDRRRVVRFSGCASLFAIAAILVVGPKTPVGLKLCPVAGLLLVAWCAAVLLYIRELALRIPNAREARRARILFIGFLVVIGISVWSAVATLVGRGSGTIVHLLGAGGWLGLVVFFMFLLQLVRFVRILRNLAANMRTADSTDKSS